MGHRMLAVPDPLWDSLVGFLKMRGFLVGAIPGSEDEDGRGTYIVSPTDERMRTLATNGVCVPSDVGWTPRGT
jgi:hypothetical protein